MIPPTPRIPLLNSNLLPCLAEYQQRMRELIETLHHKELWQEEQLATLLGAGHAAGRSLEEYALVSQDADAGEATQD